MATWRDVRRIVSALPETAEKTHAGGTATWMVRGKSFAWERPLRRSDFEALGAAAPSGAILGIRTPDLELKDALLGSDPGVFFTTPHFDGYPAILVVLSNITSASLREVLVEGWLTRAPERVAAAFLGKEPVGKKKPVAKKRPVAKKKAR